jgi:hypothetical protein
MPTTISGSSGITFPAGGVGNPAGTVIGTTDTQTLTNKTIQGGTVTSRTSQASTSGQNIEFTSIPTWVKRITMMLNTVSTGGSSLLQSQVGSTTYATSGYTGTYGVIASGTAATAAGTSGALINTSVSISASVTGTFVFTLLTGNTWTFSFTGYDSNGTRLLLSAGSIALAGTLDRIRLTTVNGTDAFDAGTVNILYE